MCRSITYRQRMFPPLEPFISATSPLRIRPSALPPCADEPCFRGRRWSRVAAISVNLAQATVSKPAADLTRDGSKIFILVRLICRMP